MKVEYRYIVLLIIIFLSGCAHSGDGPASVQDDNTPDINHASHAVPGDADGFSISNGEDKAREDINGSADNGGEESISSGSEVNINGQNLLDMALNFCDASQELWSEGRLEQAIEALDHAFGLVMKVDIVKNPELIQQKEDLRVTISKRILEIYASRYTAVNGNHKAIPLVMNKFVNDEIKRFQGVERKFFLESYTRSGMYRDEMVRALKEAGLPEELSWLPLIESGFKVRALSSARALGLWQFIPSTGYKFGLKRDTWVDERLDPAKSTTAAIAYLTELHHIFGDWATVLAGYNCGEGRVLRVIRRQKINYLDNFWDLYQRLPNETARYVPRFIAVLHILKDPEKYGFELPEPDAPLSFDTVTVEKQVQLKEVAKGMSISYNDLKGLNSELRQLITPPSLYSLKVPRGMGPVIHARLDEMPAWYAPKTAYVYHKVREGDTLSLIAVKYRTSVKAITRTNNIREKDFIRIGQKLKVPLKKGAGGRIYASREKLLPGGKYKIRKGDSLWLIARKFNTNTKTLQKLNRLTTTQLHVGQILQVEN